MQSIIINITKKLTKVSGYIESYYNQFNQYGEFEFKIPDDINTEILIELLESKKTIIKQYNNNINEILYIVNYFQLDNVILKLKYKDLSYYDEKYDIIKKIITIAQQTNNKIIDIPTNTESISCCWCKSVTDFTGYAKNMFFSWTSLSGIIDIQEGVEFIACAWCENVTGFTGYANKMNFDGTSLSGIINIPKGINSFSCYKCRKVTGFTGYANKMNFDITSLSGIINIPEKTKSFSCFGCKHVTEFTGRAKYMNFMFTPISNFSTSGCERLELGDD